MSSQPVGNDAVKGLTCPRCGGTILVPEGQAVVICPYCNQSAVVSGVRGVRRYQAPLRVDRDGAVQAWQSFLGSKVQIARDCGRQAQLVEAFLVHLPFWAVWGRGTAYAFGQVEVGSGDHKHWEPREKKIVREMTWNLPACEVGEFGVRQISLEGCELQPLDVEHLHRSGMVFEPVGSSETALETARASFEEQIRGEVNLERTAQVITRLIRTRLGLLYYPLWIVRYLYRGRSFQVAVDGSNGQVLYGKAPGSVGYRAAMLVGGMALGSVVAIDLPALVLGLGSDSSKSGDNAFIFALVLFLAGIAILFAAYRTFRYAEQYEYHRFGKPRLGGVNELNPLNLPGVPKELTDIVSVLEKFS